MKSFQIERLPPYNTPEPENAVKLPGFVKDGVTYESHTFYVEFTPEPKPLNPSYARKREFVPEVIVTVRHGGGWERLTIRDMFAHTFKALLAADNREALFFLCWGLFDLRRDAHDAGSDKTRRDLYEAFVEGRLKKRKVRGSDAVRVSVEPKPIKFEEGPGGTLTATLDLAAPNYA